MLRPYLIKGLLVTICICLSTSVLASDIAERKQTPISFTKNMGQWDEQVLYRANAGGATMWFTKQGVTYQFIRRIEKNGADPLSIVDSRLPGKDMEPDSIEQLVITAKFVGANPNPEVVGEGLMEYKCNYFIGNDPAKWYADVPNYEGFILKSVYPGIDLRFSGDDNGQAAYEFIVSPGADLAQIKVEYIGGEGTSLFADGRMILKTKLADLIVPFQAPSNGILFGTATFSQSPGDSTTSHFDGSSRQAQGTLAVSLSYSTYLGGNEVDEGHCVAVDLAGSVYVTGITESSNFPTASPFDGSFNGGKYIYDAFVTKLNPAGNSLVYSTYLGGDGDDVGNAIAVGLSGSVYVTGYTESPDFPTASPFEGSSSNFKDAFVTKLNPAGNGLVYSTYLGGDRDDVGNAIAVDSAGGAYVTGWTWSPDFPTASHFDGSFNGAVDAFVTKLSPAGNSLVYSTYLGGTQYENGNGIAVDSTGSAYVTGHTSSSNFPTASPFDGTMYYDYDAFVTKLNPAGNSLVYSTYLGGNGGDYGLDIAVDAAGSAYVTGFTSSSDFPTASPFDGTSDGGNDVFVTKLSPTGNSLVYSSYLGGSYDDDGWDIAVDNAGSVYVTGSTSSSNFPTASPFDGSYNDGYGDAFIMKLDPAGNSLVYSTYLGGSGEDRGYGIAVGSTGSVYVTGRTNSLDFPTASSFDGSFNAGDSWPDYDAFVAKVSRAYVCGDADGTGTVTISDVVFILNYIFAGGPAPDPIAAGDADGTGTLTISDAVFLIYYIFAEGPAPICP